MKLATWNVNGLRARLDYVLLWLRERQPDVVGLQELKMTDDLFPHDLFEAEGYRAEVYGQKAWNGVAVLSRHDINTSQRGLPGQDEFGSRLITTEVEGISFTTVYCPNGKSVEHDDYPRKLDWFDALASYMGGLRNAEQPTVICGDFNICPSSLDTWDEAGHADRIFHTSAERSRMQALYDLELTDTFRTLHPDSTAFSWWDYRAGSFQRNHGLRIDFILANPPAAARVESVEIDRDFRKKKEGLTASDHAPVIATLA
ncbi:MAG: exodeoxyribonuclease III [Pseudomonadota bacterium]